MIITQTPFRMSFFGGGTDMESFFRENGGAVLSTTFDKYCYVNVRHLPRFFDYSTELSYSKTERVTCIEDIQHPAIRNAMKMLDIPKDLSKVKNKVFLNLTKRQLVCMGFAAGIGVPFYFLMRDTLGTSNAAAGMVLLMLPEFFFALYEKNGMHLETILTNFISVRFKRPAVRRYEVENLYERELETAAPIQKKGGILGKK